MSTNNEGALRRGGQFATNEQQHRSLTPQSVPETHYRITTNTYSHLSSSPAVTTPSRIEIEIINPKPSTEYWYSVTLVSNNLYTGTAMNMGANIVTTDNNGSSNPTNTLLYYWKPTIDGEYQIIIHELPIFIRGNDNTPPVHVGTVTVENAPHVNSRQILLSRLQSLPSCSHIRKPGLYTQWNGDWYYGPSLSVSNEVLRTGWMFVPGSPMDCKLDYFTDDDLSVIPIPSGGTTKEKSIYIIGTSKERGVFLSLVDMMLDASEKRMLEESVISKCWGRAFLEKSHLKVLYQDWRSNFFEPPDSKPNVICHDDKVVREGGSTFVNNGFQVWREIFQDKDHWPSVILMSIGGTVGFDGEYDLQRFITELPPAWEGTLFFTDGTFSARDAGRGTIRDYEAYRAKLMELTNSLFDRRVHWLDGMGISKEMRLYAEDGPDHVSRSQHFHGHCDLPYGNGLVDEEKRIFICSNITEMVAQLMLNHALGPKEHFVEEINQLGIEPSRHSEMTYCHACPADMLPFHITPYPDMTCAKGSLHARTQNEIKKRTVPQTCPDDCLRLKVERFVPTQSGFVHERACPMDIFLPALEEQQVREARIAQENTHDQSMQLYPLGLAIFATLVFRFFFRGRCKSHAASLIGFAQLQLTGAKEVN